MKLLATLGMWNYVILAVFVFVEGPTATLVAAAAAGSGVLDPLAVFAVAAVSNLTADSFWYGVGRWGHKANVLRWAGKVGVRQATLTRYQIKMREHALKILLVAKLTLSFSVPALIVAGLSHVPWRKVILVLAAAEALWTGSLVLAGVFLGNRLAQLEQGLQIAAIVGSIVFLLLLAAFLRHQGQDYLTDDTPSV
ncbi:MAG: VTT domain-containing protein [Anaerolineae bacterium]